MTLPSSGALSLSQIQTEFGGANPISLSEYYKGGVYVSGSNGNPIPTSGTISFSQFYGATAIDVTPNNVIWGDISYETVASSGTEYTNAQIISGINTPITLNIALEYVGFTASVVILVNNISRGTVYNNQSINVTNIVNGDVVRFAVNYTLPNFASTMGNVTITNVSDSSAYLNNFNFTISSDGV